MTIISKSIMHRKETLVSAITAILLAVGCFTLPIGYYTFLRIVVFLASIVVVYLNRERGLCYQIIITVLICILFNPLIPIHLHSKTAWVVIDALSAVWFALLPFLNDASCRKKIQSLFGSVTKSGNGNL